MLFYVTKMSGEKELFDPEKLRRSLRKAKASGELIDEILALVEKDASLRTTKKIYAFAHEYLTHRHPVIAARYSLKHALLELGPAGFPFEQFIAQLFRKQGFTTQTNQLISGFCIEHEIDVICSKENKRYMVECKFHAKQKLKSDVKVPLYIKARFDDVAQAWNEQEKNNPQEFHQAWVVTNTKFTSIATKFAECRNIRLLSWSYPHGNALPDLVDQYGLHPITALTGLNKNQKKAFIKHNFVLCKDAEKQRSILKKLGFSEREITKIIKEAIEVCEL